MKKGDKGRKSDKSSFDFFSFVTFATFATFATFFHGGCSSKNSPSGKKIWIPQDVEILLGSLTAESLKEIFPPYESPGWQAYLDNLGRKIAKVSERPDFSYRFVVARSSWPNAFSSPDGTVFVTTGLLRLCATNEGEIAAVLAHEISHVSRRHGALMLQRQLGWATVMLAFFGFDRTILGTAGQVAGTLKNLGYGRDLELEADKTAVEYLKKLNYPPDSLAGFLEKVLRFEKKTGFALETYLNSHPPIQERLRHLEQSEFISK